MSKHDTRQSFSEFTKLTPAKIQDQFLELIKIAQCADIALLSHTNLDARFKNPLISNHLKRISDSVKAVKNELRSNSKYGFKSADNEYTEVAAAELWALMDACLHFGKDGIAILTRNLHLQLDEPEKMKYVYQQVNDMAEYPIDAATSKPDEQTECLCYDYTGKSHLCYYDSAADAWLNDKSQIIIVRCWIPAFDFKTNLEMQSNEKNKV